MMKDSELKDLVYQVFWDIAQHSGTYHSDIYNRLGLKNKTLLSAALHILSDEKRLLKTENKTIGGASILTFYVADPSMPLEGVLKILSE